MDYSCKKCGGQEFKFESSRFKIFTLIICKSCGRIAGILRINPFWNRTNNGAV